MISGNIFRLKNHIAEICQKINRRPEDITIVGITKYSDIETIREALACGLVHIGESKVQQALGKYPQLSGATKHMVGHLQTNKVKAAVDLFDIIQSVDSLHLAKAIEAQCLKAHRTMQVLVQVNTSGEGQKFGCPMLEADDLLKRVGDLKQIQVAGLMTIAPLTDDVYVVRDCFKKLKDLYDQATERFTHSTTVKMKFLSMGMSDDYPIALEEGANMLRIGRSIFVNT